MKVLLASSSSGSRGGGEINLLYLGRALSDFGHEVVLWTSVHPRMDELVASFSEFGSVVRANYKNTYDYRLRSISAFIQIAVSHRIAEHWKPIRPDIIHVNKQNLEDGLDLLRAADYLDCPSVCNIYITQTADYLNARFGRIRDWVAKYALRKYEGTLVAVQGRRRGELSDFLGENTSVHSINQGVPLYNLPLDAEERSKTRAQYDVEDDELLFVGVGRLEPQKRPFYFLDVARRIHAAHPAARFLWVGDGSLRSEWLQEVEAYGLRDVVACTGWQEDVEPFLAAADIFLHVAEYEGLPLALLEAMSAGLPCALPDVLVADFEVIAPDHVLVIDAWDDFLLAVKDPVRRQRVANRGRKLVESALSVEHMARQYEALYRSVIQEAPA